MFQNMICNSLPETVVSAHPYLSLKQWCRPGKFGAGGTLGGPLSLPSRPLYRPLLSSVLPSLPPLPLYLPPFPLIPFLPVLSPPFP